MLGGGEELAHECYVAMSPPYHLTDDKAGCTAGTACLICPVCAGLGLV